MVHVILRVHSPRAVIFSNILLTEEEFIKLQEKFNTSLQERIDNLSEAIEAKGYKYKSHYAALLNWARRDQKQGGNHGKE